jgi:hypothetical protein
MDTSGELGSDMLKIYCDKSAAVASLVPGDNNKRVLNISLGNVKSTSIPGIKNANYVSFLTYNGTLGYNKKVFSTVVSVNKGAFDPASPPVLVYNPDNFARPCAEDLPEVVMEIKLYNGTVDVLRYSEGRLSGGEKEYNVMARSYPTVITELPNASGSQVFIDGWYSFTSIIFRELLDSSVVIANDIYNMNGFIFKATDNGKVFWREKKVVIETDKGVIVPQAETADYIEILHSLTGTSGVSAQSRSIYVHTQLMVTDRLRDAITEEAVKAAFADPTDYVEFQTWQKLTLKRTSAYIMFENGLFEKAQIILESARAICVEKKYNSLPNNY